MGRCDSHSGAGGTAAFLGGIGIGAALMYMLDPDRGRRRRAMARDRAVSAANKAGRAFSSTSRDMNNRAKSMAAELRTALGCRDSHETERIDTATDVAGTPAQA